MDSHVLICFYNPRGFSDFRPRVDLRGDDQNKFLSQLFDGMLQLAL